MTVWRRSMGTTLVAALIALATLCPGCATGADAAGAAGAADVGAVSADSTAADGTGGDGAEACDEPLFGAPGAHTGLTSAQCAPRCGCGAATWTPRSWSQAELDALATWQLEAPLPLPAVDPYTDATLDVAPPPAGAVCAVAVVDRASRRYRLVQRASAEAAVAAGEVVTHAGRCGLCSSLVDLAVYAGTPDLTDPVRQCGILGITDGHAASAACLQKLGFSHPCAEIWAWNTDHTRKVCLDVCLPLLKAKSHLPDGALNACIACDEEASGPVFKVVAGRTRRNSGLPSALCRPCESVARIDHDYD